MLNYVGGVGSVGIDMPNYVHMPYLITSRDNRMRNLHQTMRGA